MSRRLLTAVVLAVAAVALAFVAVEVLGGDDDPAPSLSATSAAEPDHAYVIPPGTGERIDAGEDIRILPATLEVQVGEVLRIVNEDSRGHLVGPFFVGAGETMTQRFNSPGELEGDCSVHTDGRFRLVVRP